MIELTCRRALRCVALAFSALLFACGGGEPAPQDGQALVFGPQELQPLEHHEQHDESDRKSLDSRRHGSPLAAGSDP